VSDPFRIKICGITSEDAARAAVEAGADHLGVILCPSVRRLSRERAAELVSNVPASWIGVFMDSRLEEMQGAADELGLAGIQLHGRETPELCRAVREATGLPVWKAIAFELPDSEARYRGAVDALLVDAGRGGSRRALDWDAVAARLPRAERDGPQLHAGGQAPDNVDAAIRRAEPDGVDASSGLERAPGVKDPELVRAFVTRARGVAGETAPSDVTGAAR